MNDLQFKDLSPLLRKEDSDVVLKGRFVVPSILDAPFKVEPDFPPSSSFPTIYVLPATQGAHAPVLLYFYRNLPVLPFLSGHMETRSETKGGRNPGEFKVKLWFLAPSTGIAETGDLIDSATHYRDV